MGRHPQSISCIQMLITFIDGLCPNIYLLVVLHDLTEKEINNIDSGEYEEDSKIIVILEVDLEYSQELHNLYNDYPLAPEK